METFQSDMPSSKKEINEPPLEQILMVLPPFFFSIHLRVQLGFKWVS